MAADEPTSEAISEPVASADPDTLDVLRSGEVELVGRMPWSSNATFLARVTAGERCIQTIYKPRRGERPLWDFPSGLDRREVAAYELSEALGWGLVPETILRDGPHGTGSFQRFIDADLEEHYYTLFQAGRHLDRLRAMCVFDFIANNTDRKSGHCLVTTTDQLFGIDHGLCFHAEFKLRTVIWEFAGEPIPAELLEDVATLADEGLPEPLADLLAELEAEALLVRARHLLRTETFPYDETGRRYPWPLV